MRGCLDREVQRRQNGSGARIFRARPAVLANHLPAGGLEPSRQKTPNCSRNAPAFHIEVNGADRIWIELNCEAPRSSPLRFDLPYGAPQPIPHRIFDLFLGSAAVEILQCLPFLRERDVAARNLWCALVRWRP